MVEKTTKNSQSLFLLFNISLLLTFPFKPNQPLISQLIQTSKFMLDWIPILGYLSLITFTFIKKDSEFSATIRILSLLFAFYHLIHLLFYV